VGCVTVLTTGVVGVLAAAVITTAADAGEVQPPELVTVKLYVPGSSPAICVLAPVPVTEPGLIVHSPAGKLLSTTLPVGTAQEGWIIDPTIGDVLTFNVYVTVEAEQGEPNGLSVVRVIVTMFPSSPAAGVYVKANGEADDETGVTEPAPFSDIDTFAALVKVLPLIVIGIVTQVLPFIAERESEGALVQPHVSKKLLPVVVQPEASWTVIE
jgi:hypothetical protein